MRRFRLRPVPWTVAAVTVCTMSADAADRVSQKPEFVEIARRLQASPNRLVGKHVPGLRAAIASETEGTSLERRLELRARLALELLKEGQVDEALELAEWVIALSEAKGVQGDFPALYRVRAIVLLRKAEVENCIARHNAECCIFPLDGGGVHATPEFAARARQDYLTYLESFPQDLGVRWLLNLSAMAVGAHPDGVPERFRIPPSAFASEQDVGRFVDVAPQLGIDTFNLCGGAIVDDFDDDGFLDIVTSTFDLDGPLTGYRNLGDGRFEDRTADARLDDQLGGLNCIGGDYDGDGDIDVLVLRGAWLFDDGQIRNSLLQSDDDGTFTDVTRAVGLADPNVAPAPTQAAAWGDFDLDGDLDLYVGNEARPDEPGAGDYPSQLFINRGPDAEPRFLDVATEAGVRNDQYCKGVAVGDYDNDGDLDLYVSNFGPNRLYRNDGDADTPRFTNVAATLGVAGPDRSFATWFFDYDNDGWLDLFVATYEAPIAAVAADHLGLPYSARHPALYRNLGGSGTVGFRDVSAEVGLDHAWLPMGASFGDIDNDGYLDVYLATGSPEYESLMPNVMLRNDGGRRFVNVTTSAGLGHLQKGHGVVFADIDNDGDQDLYHQLGGFFRGDGFHNALFLNPGHGHRFLVLRLVGTESHPSGFGARVKVVVKTPEGSREIHRAAGSVSSFGGSPRRQEIGLGDAEAIERIEVWWPASGRRQVLTDVPLDSFIGIVEGREGFERLPLGPVPLAAAARHTG